jgi:hypothetical protein
LWMNGPSRVTSSMHFDSYNNLLCVYVNAIQRMHRIAHKNVFSQCFAVRFHGCKALHLHPPSSSHLAPPWSHTPNAPTPLVRASLMRSTLKCTGLLQQVPSLHAPASAAPTPLDRGTWHLFLRGGGMRCIGACVKFHAVVNGLCPSRRSPRSRRQLR